MGDFTQFVELKPSDVKTISATKVYPYGKRGVTADGRVYRYAYVGTTVPCGVPAMTIALTLLDGDTSYAASINDTEDIGTTWRSFTVETETSTGAIAVNEYADGYTLSAYSTKSASQGQLMQIKSHDASGTSSTDALGSTMTVVFADEDKLAIAMTTGDKATLHHNPYYGILPVTGGAATAGGCVGVPNVAITATYYGWLQTWGPCAVCQDGLLVTGSRVSISTDTDEAVATIGTRTSTQSTAIDATADTTDPPIAAGQGFIHGVAYTQQMIGWAMGTPGTDQYWGLIFLTIAP